MLIFIEGDLELYEGDQVHLSPPADPNYPDTFQPGKTWIGRFAQGMCP